MRKKLGIFLLLLIVYIYWGTHALEVNHVNIANERIPAVFNGYKIVQLSDLHNKDFGPDLIRKVAEQRPNLIAVTGDLIDSNSQDYATALTAMEGLLEIAPVYYVTGNHEASNFKLSDELDVELDSLGVKLMDNRLENLEKDGATIQIVGLEDPNFINSALSFEDKYARLQRVLNKMATDEFYQILLSHRPEAMDSYTAEAIDLVLSGHAHGGQIRLPIIGAVFAPGQGFFPKYSNGLYSQSETTMLVNRGLGNSGIPFRFMNRPEIVVVTLENG